MRLVRILALLLASVGLGCSGSDGGGTDSLDIELAPLAQVSPADIVSIRLTVSDASGTQVASDTQPFTPGQSTVFELFIEPGTGYLFVAEGLDANGDAIYRGSDTADVGESGTVNLTIRLSSLVAECTDADGDGYGDPGSSSCPAGVLRDCDDSDAAINPGAPDVCNGIDDNCNGRIDERNVCEEACVDGDGDGYGRPGDASCPGGALPDCNDDDPNVFPRNAETCNGVDDDCDGRIDEGFDRDFDGFTQCNGDCNDFSNLVFPGADELCNEQDDDCDGDIDEGDICAQDCVDADSDGYGQFGGVDCPNGTAPDCDDNNPAVNPGATEVCDADDNDCDGLTDEGFDADADTYTSCGGDCDDGDPDVNPDAAEVCDGIDNNCADGIDEGFDADGDTYTTCNGDCDDADPGVNPGAAEICDGIDQDCDDEVDSTGPIGPDLYVGASNTSGFEVGSEECPYDTIQEGIDAVTAGNTVNVAAGNYTPFDIDARTNIEVVGAGNSTVVQGSGQSAAVVDSSTGIRIANMLFGAGGGQFFGPVILLSGGNLTLEGLTIAVNGYNSGVTIEANGALTVQGSTMTGPFARGADDTRGVQVQGVNLDQGSVTATNVSISGFENGIECGTNGTCTVNGSSDFSDNSFGLRCFSGATCTVSGSATIRNSQSDGIACLSGSSCTLASGASSNGNALSGIYCDGTNQCLVQGTANGNGEVGIFCDDGAGCNINGATATGNTDSAVFASSDFSITNSLVGDSIAGEVGPYGIELNTSGFVSGATITGNTIRNNSSAGIQCFAPRAGTRGVTFTCTGNTFQNNGTDVASCPFTCTP